MAALVTKDIWLGSKISLKQIRLLIGTGAPADSDLIATRTGPNDYPVGTMYIDTAAGALYTRVKSSNPGVASDYGVQGATSTTVAPAGDVAALTDNSGGAAADGTIGVVTLPNLSSWDGATVFPSAAQGAAIVAAETANRDAIKELSTKVNAILTSLKAASLMS